MTDLGAASAEATVDISADPDTVYRLITDLDTLAEVAEEATAMQWRKGDAARPGAVFKGENRNGAKRWTTTCTVTDADAGRVFAFDVKTAAVVPVAHWRYDIAATSAGCTVTERTWDRRPRWIRKPAELTTGVADRTAANSEHIRLTLQRLKAKAEAGS
jgi:uncharacterized protein YndB with AHSA1/START domain